MGSGLVGGFEVLGKVSVWTLWANVGAKIPGAVRKLILTALVQAVPKGGPIVAQRKESVSKAGYRYAPFRCFFLHLALVSSVAHAHSEIWVGKTWGLARKPKRGAMGGISFKAPVLSADSTFEEPLSKYHLNEESCMLIGMDPPIWDAAPIWETWKELPSPKVGHIKGAAPRLEQPPDSVHSAGAAEATPDNIPD
jgi:hypothetical protein